VTAVPHTVNRLNQSSGAAEFATSVKSCHRFAMMMTVSLWELEEISKNQQSINGHRNSTACTMAETQVNLQK